MVGLGHAHPSRSHRSLLPCPPFQGQVPGGADGGRLCLEEPRATICSGKWAGVRERASMCRHPEA